MPLTTRRDFLKTGLAATVLAGTGASPAKAAAKRSATDLVTLGNSGVKVTRLAMGTGTFAGRVQRELGQESFTRLVRYAYDQGIRFFESAESYGGMHQMLATALKGIPRDSYRLMTKYSMRTADNPQQKIDRFRKELNSEYVDILLMHAMRNPQWPEQTKAVQDAFSEAQSKKIVLAKGASIHGLQGLGACPGNKWLDVTLIRINHDGTRMDTPSLQESDEKGDVEQVVAHAKKIRGQGTGLLGMKLIGEGQFTTPERREASLKFVMERGVVDAVTIGFKSTEEVDEAISRINRALNA
jgi:1-deoxyxylulose-5-phosphate synthase